MNNRIGFAIAAAAIVLMPGTATAQWWAFGGDMAGGTGGLSAGENPQHWKGLGLHMAHWPGDDADDWTDDVTYIVYYDSEEVDPPVPFQEIININVITIWGAPNNLNGVNHETNTAVAYLNDTASIAEPSRSQPILDINLTEDGKPVLVYGYVERPKTSGTAAIKLFYVEGNADTDGAYTGFTGDSEPGVNPGVELSASDLQFPEDNWVVHGLNVAIDVKDNIAGSVPIPFVALGVGIFDPITNDERGAVCRYEYNPNDPTIWDSSFIRWSQEMPLHVDVIIDETSADDGARIVWQESQKADIADPNKLYTVEIWDESQSTGGFGLGLGGKISMSQPPPWTDDDGIYNIYSSPRAFFPISGNAVVRVDAEMEDNGTIHVAFNEWLPALGSPFNLPTVHRVSYSPLTWTGSPSTPSASWAQVGPNNTDLPTFGLAVDSTTNAPYKAHVITDVIDQFGVEKIDHFYANNTVFTQKEIFRDTSANPFELVFVHGAVSVNLLSGMPMILMYAPDVNDFYMTTGSNLGVRVERWNNDNTALQGVYNYDLSTNAQNYLDLEENGNVYRVPWPNVVDGHTSLTEAPFGVSYDLYANVFARYLTTLTHNYKLNIFLDDYSKNTLDDTTTPLLAQAITVEYGKYQYKTYKMYEIDTSGGCGALPLYGGSLSASWGYALLPLLPGLLALMGWGAHRRRKQS